MKWICSCRIQRAMWCDLHNICNAYYYLTNFNTGILCLNLVHKAWYSSTLQFLLATPAEELTVSSATDVTEWSPSHRTHSSWVLTLTRFLTLWCWSLSWPGCLWRPCLFQILLNCLIDNVILWMKQRKHKIILYIYPFWKYRAMG